jgi:hypothetical protein|tara:strand:- start:1266 stop:2150 length:885 start_codon:yes stop_codon:yes gene_type:complete
MPEIDDEMVDVPTEGKSVTVEVNKDDMPGSIEPVAASTEDSDDDEHLDYSKNVKKRIDKLTRKAREAERQQDAAISFARNMQTENQALKGRVQNLDVGYVNEYGDRIASQTDSLEKELETAIATSDTAAQVEAQKKLSQLAIEEERVRAAKAEQNRMQQQPPPQQAQQAPQVPSRPDPEAEEWARKNEWFGKDDAMTFASFGIHKTLVEQEAFDTSSPEYYAEIDKRMKEAFPHKFNGGSQEVSVSEGRRPQQAVASATRSSSSGRKTVKLTPSEVSIANKLGVPLDEYAKYKR